MQPTAQEDAQAARASLLDGVLIRLKLLLLAHLDELIEPEDRAQCNQPKKTLQDMSMR